MFAWKNHFDFVWPLLVLNNIKLILNNKGGHSQVSLVQALFTCSSLLSAWFFVGIFVYFSYMDKNRVTKKSINWFAPKLTRLNKIVNSKEPDGFPKIVYPPYMIQTLLSQSNFWKSVLYTPIRDHHTVFRFRPAGGVLRTMDEGSDNKLMAIGRSKIKLWSIQGSLWYK